MKSTFSRRYRRSVSRSSEPAVFKKDSQQEQPFFSPATTQSFFKPNVVISRKCEHCEAEDKQVKRTDEKKEDKSIHKMEEKKEEDKSIHKMEEKKEEEKPVIKMEEKKEEDKSIHKMEEKKEEDKKIAAKQDVGSEKASSQTGSYINSLGGKGNSLPLETQQFFKQRMGYDFSHVKIHTDASAQQSAKELSAKAYAVDNNIVFDKGRYDPASAGGKKLLAHELTHVAQHTGSGQAVLKKADDLLVNRKEETTTVSSSGKASNSKNKTNFGCEGVDVQGQTDANYTDSFSSSGNSKPSTKCDDCKPPECIASSGTVVSTFKANPVVTLPAVPDGLTPCETKAVGKFIHTTLKNHEQQHVAAFKTYNATIKTPYKFAGCQADLDAYIKTIHNDINQKRLEKANAKSDKLDPFNKPIPCNCKD